MTTDRRAPCPLAPEVAELRDGARSLAVSVADLRDDVAELRRFLLGRLGRGLVAVVVVAEVLVKVAAVLAARWGF